MQDVAAVRRAALDAVDDVEPPRLQERITELLEGSAIAPGQLTVACASAAIEQRSGGTGADGQELPDAISERAAGVQLIYEGLSQTRGLAADPPWTAGGKGQADIDILIADILVARGFYLLARTEAADAAVETVRSFGRDQTVARETGGESLDTNLERDVFELATVAGTTAVGSGPSPQLQEFATGLVAEDTPPTLPADLDERLGSLITIESTGSEGVRTSADH